MFHHSGVLLLAPGLDTPVLVVVHAQPVAFPLAPLDDFGIVVPQLAAQTEGVQVEHVGYLRDVVLDVGDVVAGADGLAVLGAGGGGLAGTLAQAGRRRLFGRDLHAVAGEHQLAVAGMEERAERCERYARAGADFPHRQAGRAVQLDSLAVFLLRLRPWGSHAVLPAFSLLSHRIPVPLMLRAVMTGRASFGYGRMNRTARRLSRGVSPG